MRSDMNVKKIAIVAATGFSFFGNGMHFIAISWLVLQITDNPLYVSILVVLGVIPGFISSPFAGVIADRYNKKSIAISMDLLRFVVVLAIPLTSFLFGISLWVLYVATVLITLGSNFFFPAISGMIKISFPREEYLKILSANSTLLQIGMIGGSGLAGFIIAKLSIYHVFYIDAFTYGISALCLMFINYKEPGDKRHEKKTATLFNDMKQGFTYVIRNKNIMFLFLIGIIPNGLTHTVNSILGVYTKDFLGLGPTAYGILDASFAIGYVLAGTIFALISLKITEKMLLTYGFLIMSIGMFALSISQNLLLATVSLSLVGIAMMLTSPTRKSLLMQQVNDEYVGRVESLNWMFFSSVSPIIAILMSLISGYNVQIPFLILATLLLFSFLMSNYFLKKSTFEE